MSEGYDQHHKLIAGLRGRHVMTSQINPSTGGAAQVLVTRVNVVNTALDRQHGGDG
jgi:hypothetical protein